MRTRLEFDTSGSIDLMDDIPYSLNYAIADIREPAARSASYSKTIKIPGSKSNNIIFSHIFEINIQSNFNPNLKKPFRLYVDELLQMQGFIQLLKINKTDDNKIEYEIALKGNVGNIFTEWAEQMLTDLNLSAYNHTYNKATQQASWSAAVGVGYVYPMIDYGITNGLTYDVENFYPAIYVKQYIDAMFTLAGYTYSSAFFDTDFFKRLIIPYNSTTLLLSTAELDSRYFKAKRNADYVAKTWTTLAVPGSLIGGGLTTRINFDTDVSDVNNQYSTTLFEYTNQDKGSYNFTNTINWTLSVSGLAGPSITLSILDIYFHVGIMDSFGNMTPVHVQQYLMPLQTINNNGTSATFTTTFTTPTTILLAGSKYVTSVSMAARTVGVAGVFNLNILADSTFQNKAINEGVFDGDAITMNSMVIPRNIKIKDFFTSIIKMFNLYIETDKTVTNKLYIEPRNDFYAAGVTKDWTDKLSVDRIMDIDPMGELNASRYVFKYKDDKDYYNAKYQNSFLEPYGSFNKDIETDFVRGTKIIDIIFSPTPLVQIGTTDRIISQITALDATGGLTDVKGSNIRILYYTLKNTANSWQYTGAVSGTTTETTYPYAGHVDVPLNPTFDLSFGVPQQIFYDTSLYTNNHLFNKYWKEYIDEITDKDSKIITAWFYLTPLDIYLLDFRNQFFVDGNLLRLNKIYDYNPLSNELTKCEFIRIKKALPFVAQNGFSIYGNNLNFDFAEFVPIPLPDDKKNKFDNGGGVFVGSGNVVDSTVTKSLVLGTNNYVGPGASGVSILSSSGVTILPGVTGVTLINSNDVLVTESNTTYVNGLQVTGTPSEQGITAYAGGGQDNAYQTTKKFNLIETVATAGDSIKTITATLDQEQQFKNVGANSMNVFPKSGERFRKGATLLAVDASYAVASRNSLHIYCYETGIWTD